MSTPNVDDYLDWFGLKRAPFGLAPDPEFLFLSNEHAETLAALELGILERRGLVLLVGEVGTGKTTVLRTTLDGLGATVDAAYVSSTTLDFVDILRLVIEELGVEHQGDSKADLLKALKGFVEQADEDGRIVVLVIDEAQNLSDASFEELRLLLNFETPQRKLLQIVLAGQPELHDKLALPALRHVADRVAVRCYLNPLTNDETGDYIAHRLHQAAASEALFEPAAVKVVSRASRGVPRALNVLCHNSLLFAFGHARNRVDASTARAAVRERRGEGFRRRGPLGRRLGFAAAALTLAALVVVVAWMFWRSDPTRSEDSLSATPEPPSSPAATAAASNELRPEAASLRSTASTSTLLVPSDTTAAGGMASAAASSRIEIVEGATLYDLILEHYGDYSPELLRRVLDANPWLVEPEQLTVGDSLVLPPAIDPEPSYEAVEEAAPPDSESR